MLASSHLNKHNNDLQLEIYKDLTSPSVSAKNLGVFLGQHLNVETHVANISMMAYFHMRNIKCLRQILTNEALTSVIHAFIISRLN